MMTAVSPFLDDVKREQLDVKVYLFILLVIKIVHCACNQLYIMYGHSANFSRFRYPTYNLGYMTGIDM